MPHRTPLYMPMKNADWVGRGPIGEICETECGGLAGTGRYDLLVSCVVILTYLQAFCLFLKLRGLH